jgi:hypothetical protein
MNRTQIISLVLARLGRQEGNSYLTAQAELELTLIQETLEGGAFLPWFLLSDETELTYTANNRSVSLSAGFLREYEDFPLYHYDSTQDDAYTKLEKDEFDYLEGRYGENATGTVPKEYSLQGDQYQLFPTPTESGVLRYKCYEREAELTDSVLTNAWTANAPDLLVAELGTVMAGYMKDAERLQMFIAQRGVAMQRLVAFDIARQQALRDAQRGDRS